MTRVISARLRDACLIEDRINWGTTFNEGEDQQKQKWALALDDNGWLVIRMMDMEGNVKKLGRVPPDMIRIVFEVPTDPLREIPTNPEIKAPPTGDEPSWRHPKAIKR